MNGRLMPTFQDLCSDPNCGWSVVLESLTEGLSRGTPQCLVRYGDGELWSMLGRAGPNADGQQMLPMTLGKELHQTLCQIADDALPNVLVGSDWRVPEQARDYLTHSGFSESISWCPVQPFVMGIESGLTMRLLEAVRDWSRGERILVGPPDLSLIVNSRSSLFDRHLVVDPHDAYSSMRKVEETLPLFMSGDDVVVWCAGLGCKPSVYRTFKRHPGVTCLDLGCFFDLAVGKQSRTWMTEPPDARGWEYRREYAPFLLGEKPLQS